MRITGLWGSSFSRAIGGNRLPITKTYMRGLLNLFKNLIFFIPKRDITVEVEWAPSDFPRKGSRLEVNKALENWYNKHGPEPLQLVSYAFWKKEMLPLQTKSEEEILTVEMVPQTVRERVIAEIAEITEQDPHKIEPGQNLAKDLGLDSIDEAQLVVFLREQYGVTELHSSDLSTVASVMLFAAHLKVGGKMRRRR